MKSTAPQPPMPKEVEALRTSLESRLSALEKALADPRQHGSLDSLILDLARIATQEADATARHAVLAAQQAGQKLAANARAEAKAALEAEKVESAALRQVIEGAKLALKQAEAALKEERRAAEAGNRDVAAARQELAALQESLAQEQSARARERGDLDAALAAIEGERRAAAEAARVSSEREPELEALRAELEALRGELESTRAALDATRSERDSMQRDLEGTRRELDSVRQDSETRTQTLSHSQAEQQQALSAAQDAVRSAEARIDESHRERDAAQNEVEELKRQLEEAAQAVRDADAVNRELQAAHEARDAAEVLEAARSERPADIDADDETVVDLTSHTHDEEREQEIDRRTRALELALRDAESRAELAELELARHRRRDPSIAEEPAGMSAATQTAEMPVPNDAQEFRGPARGARRVTFRADIPVQVDGTPGKLVDLSVSGAQVLAPAAINPNRLVTVILPIDDNTIPCKAKVMWSRLEPRAGQLWYRAGVMFTNPDQPALEAFLKIHQA